LAAVSATFAVLAEPTRRRLLDELLAGERSVGELVERTGLPQPTVSKHLRTMRDAGVVTARVDGPVRWYRLEPDGLSEVDRWLAPYRRLWAERLDALERHLARDEEERR